LSTTTAALQSMGKAGSHHRVLDTELGIFNHKLTSNILGYLVWFYKPSTWTGGILLFKKRKN